MINLRNIRLRYPFTTSTDYYRVLGLTNNATHQQIRIQYYSLAKKYHPDLTRSEDKEQFIRIKQAYDVLGNINSKSEYDRKIRRNQQRQNQTKYYRSQEEFYAKYQNGPTNQNFNKRQKNVIRFGVASLFASAIYLLLGFRSSKTTQYQVRKNNIILRNQNINSTPGVMEKRRKILQEQRKAKQFSIVPITIHFDQFGNAYTNQNNIKPSKRRTSQKLSKKNGLDSLPNVRKKIPVRTAVQREGQPDYI